MCTDKISSNMNKTVKDKTLPELLIQALESPEYVNFCVCMECRLQTECPSN